MLAVAQKASIAQSVPEQVSVTFTSHCYQRCPPRRDSTLTEQHTQAIDAKRAAAEEVERLLQHPEDLKRLSGLLEDYTQKHQACWPFNAWLQLDTAGTFVVC